MKVSNKVAKVVLPLSAGFMLTSFTVLGIGVVTSFGIVAYQVYLYLVRGVWEWLTVADFSDPEAPIVSLMGTWPAIVPLLGVCGTIYAVGLSISQALERLLPNNDLADLASSFWAKLLFFYALPPFAIVVLLQASRYVLSGE